MNNIYIAIIILANLRRSFYAGQKHEVGDNPDVVALEYSSKSQAHVLKAINAIMPIRWSGEKGPVKEGQCRP